MTLEPRCPECGAVLEKRHFVDAWASDGTPSDEAEQP